MRAESATLEAALQGDPDGARLLIAESAAGEPGGFVYLEQHIDYFRQTPHGHVSVLAVAAEVEGQYQRLGYAPETVRYVKTL